MSEKIIELKKRTVEVLEKTKKDKEKYAKERKIIDNFFIESSKKDNLEEWEKFLISFEEKLK